MGRKEVEESIRALCLFDPFGKCIFHWTGGLSESEQWVRRLENEFSFGSLSKVVKGFIKEASLTGNLSRTVEYEGHLLVLRIHRWFLIVAEVDSEEDLGNTLPRLLRTVSDAIKEDPLSFCELLPSGDMPGKNKLAGQLVHILNSQEGGVGVPQEV